MRTFGDGYRAEHRLVDGASVVVRPIAPSDADELRRAFALLSPASRLQRFLRPTPDLTDEYVTYLTCVDGESHVAFVAFLVSPDLKSERGVGVARYVRRADDARVAEAAVTVIDEAQGRGIAHLLLATLVAAARERGVEAFEVDVLATNHAVRRLLAEARAELWADDGETMTFRVPLEKLVLPDELRVRRDGFVRALIRATAEVIEAARSRAERAGAAG